MECPKCDKALGRFATYCSCGWSKPKLFVEAPRHINCAHANCDATAMIKQRTDAGWINLCVVHDTQLHREQAIQRCADKGLDTPAKCYQWWKDNPMRFASFTRSGRTVEEYGLPGEVGFLGDSS